jgi:hypothetical protein
MGMMLSYIIWYFVTENGLRSWPRRKRRRRYTWRIR